MAALIFSPKASESSQLKIVVDTKYFETRKKEDLYFLRFFHFCRNGCDLIELIKLQLKSPQAEQVVTFFIYLKCHDFFAESKLPNAKIFRAHWLLPYLCSVGNSDPSENRTQFLVLRFFHSTSRVLAWPDKTEKKIKEGLTVCGILCKNMATLSLMTHSFPWFCFLMPPWPAAVSDRQRRLQLN